MENVEVTSISSRGQVVIPQNLRNKMGIHTGEKFVVIGEEDTIVLKKLEMPTFNGIDRLFKKTRDFAKKKGLKKLDIGESIKQVRKK